MGVPNVEEGPVDRARGRLAVGLAAVALAMAAGPGALRAGERGGPLAPIRQLVADLRYEEAAKEIPEVLESGELSAADTAAAYRLGGELFGAVGDADRARDYFERWLMLVPDGALDEGVSPKIAEPFEAARARVDKTGSLRVRPVVARAGDAVRVEVVVDEDPLEMVAGLRVSYGIGDGAPIDRVERSDELSLELEVPDGQSVRLVIAVTDDRGNELVARAAEAPAGAALGGSARASGSAPAWYARWYTWAGVAGASAGVGVYFGLRARSDVDDLEALNADSSSHSFAEAQEVERRGKRNALLANVSFGVAGAAAVVAVIFGVRGNDSESAKVEPMVNEDGGGLSWSIRF